MLPSHTCVPRTRPAVVCNTSPGFIFHQVVNLFRGPRASKVFGLKSGACVGTFWST